MIKRYFLGTEKVGGHTWAATTEHAAGQWVKYDDHQAALDLAGEAYREQIARLSRQLAELKEHYND